MYILKNKETGEKWYSPIEVLDEEAYKPNNHLKYLKNKHYHHSEKGCKIEMGIEYGNRKGELPQPGVVKRCFTHNVVCSKTGWERGWYAGERTDIDYCMDCGKEINYKSGCYLCDNCKIKRRRKSLIKATNKHRQKMKDLKIKKLPRNCQK
jgi:hypothetical protein